jgi:hypothetical protein
VNIISSLDIFGIVVICHLMLSSLCRFTVSRKWSTGACPKLAFIVYQGELNRSDLSCIKVTFQSLKFSEILFAAVLYGNKDFT